MKKLHELKEGDLGTYDNIECEITDVEEGGISIFVNGLFGRRFFLEYTYKSIFHKLFNLPTITQCTSDYHKTIEISYYNFKQPNK